jgi:hypothetical protein
MGPCENKTDSTNETDELAPSLVDGHLVVDQAALSFPSFLSGCRVLVGTAMEDRQDLDRAERGTAAAMSRELAGVDLWHGP